MVNCLATIDCSRHERNGSCPWRHSELVGDTLNGTVECLNNCIFAAQKAELGIEGKKFWIRLLNTTVFHKMKQLLTIFFIHQVSSLRQRWNIYTFLCEKTFQKDCEACNATQNRTSSQILNKRDKRADRKCDENYGRAIHTDPTFSQFRWKERSTSCGQRGPGQNVICSLNGWNASWTCMTPLSIR